MEPAWEITAGKLRPKPKPRPRPLSEVALIVEADLSRPVRDYVLSESYASGDRIAHKTLGTGIVQGAAGRGKIHVLFGERKSLLVHERSDQRLP